MTWKRENSCPYRDSNSDLSSQKIIPVSNLMTVSRSICGCHEFWDTTRSVLHAGFLRRVRPKSRLTFGGLRTEQLLEIRGTVLAFLLWIDGGSFLEDFLANVRTGSNLCDDATMKQPMP
jgi:hypothetical protein